MTCISDTLKNRIEFSIILTLSSFENRSIDAHYRILKDSVKKDFQVFLKAYDVKVKQMASR